jgi:hypothetical protein
LGGFIQGKIDQECDGCLHCLPAEVLSSGLHTLLPPLPRLTLELGPRSTLVLTGIEPCDTIAVAEQLLHVHKFSWLHRKQQHWVKQVSPDATTENALTSLHALRSIAHVDLGPRLADSINTRKATFMDIHTSPHSTLNHKHQQKVVRDQCQDVPAPSPPQPNNRLVVGQHSPSPPTPTRPRKRLAESDINL